MDSRIWKEKKAWAFCAMLAGSPAAALECTFAVECLEGEACTSSGYELSIQDGMVRDVSGEAEARVVTETASVTAWVWAVEGQVNFLTLDTFGQARYLAHLPEADMAIYYKGQCA